ncbi:MAG: SEC-C metal-binding domain-containing protein [Candidatus Neomarinimicrobiota bacterium]
MKSGRNKPCHCGSGKKFKKCHEKRNAGKTIQFFVIGAVCIGFISFGFIVTSITNDLSSDTINSPKPMRLQETSFFTKSDRNAPPGKVWSPEHGHWHDAPKSNQAMNKLPDKDNSSSKKTIDGKDWEDDHVYYDDK